MEKISSFKELIAWNKSMSLAENCYKLTNLIPKNEQFGLISQIRRCAVSIPSNIAEGSKRGSRRDFAQFLKIASGSCAELETQLILTRSIYNLSVEKELSDLLEIQKMLSVLIKKLST